MAPYFPYDVKLRIFAHSRSFLANQKARNAIFGAENLLITLIRNKMVNRHLIFTQISVNLVGVILTASVTTRAKSVQTGQMRFQNVEKQIPFLLM